MDDDDIRIADALLDKLYAVAVEPERFAELVEAWEQAMARGTTAERTPDWPLVPSSRQANRADAILAVVEQTDAQLDTLQKRLDAESQAMLALDASGSVKAVNRAAHQRYGLTEGGRLDDLPLPEGALRELRETLRRLLHKREAGSDGTALLRLERESPDAALVVALTRWTTPGGLEVVLLKTTDFVWPDTLTPLVARAFGLTEAEADVVRMIVEGASVERVAQARGRSIATVRSQIRSIYEKTATRSQAEFIRMAVGLTTLQLTEPATAARGASATGAASVHPLPDHRRILTLPDGRLLDYADFGAADGRPCLYFPNLFGDGWPTALAEQAGAQGLRIIAPARPCFGRSSPYPPDAVGYRQVAEDMLVLLDHLGVDRALTLSQTIGGMFALALARAAPERVAALVAIAPELPWGTAGDETRMPLFFRFMSSVVLRYPDMLEFVLRSGTAYQRRVGWQRWLERIFRESEVDLAAIRDPANAALFEHGNRYSTVHGHQAVLGDYRSIMTDAREVLLELERPLFAVIGSEDRNHRGVRADGLIEAGAPIRKRTAPGGGQLLMLTHPELILDTVQEAWAEGT
ncbi:MAG: alpha/beta fold hydrolase [Pseudomonadales bacterium]|nr:alpha/beta fold hydrolase [Pseudomonadales bacterium]